MNNVKGKILPLFLGEFYFFWTAGLTAGIYTGTRYDLYNIYITTAGIAFVILLMIAAILKTRRILYEENTTRFTILVIIPFLTLFIIGNLVISVFKYNENENVFLLFYESEESAGNNIVIEGRVSNHPKYKYGHLDFLLEVDKVHAFSCKQNSDNFLNIKELLNIRLSGKNSDFIIRDDYFRLVGSLGKNNSKYITAGKYNGIIFKADYEDVKEIECSNLSYKIFSFRKRLYGCLKNAFYRNLKSEDACIAEAVILGNRNNVPEYLTKAFKRCGLYHLFAISGLHLSFFVSLICLVFKKVRSSNFMLWAVIVFLIIYNFLVGERASMLRASVMVIFILLARRWNREHSLKILLYLSYIMIIIYNPYFLYDLGFWMSYGSIAALVFVHPFVLRLVKNIFTSLNRGVRFFIKIALITLSIQAVLFPVSAYFFGEVSLISPLVNVLIIPAFYILLLILMVSSFIIIIWPPAGSPFLNLSAIVFECILKTVKILSKFDFCVISFDSFTVKNVIVYYMVFLIILFVIYMIIKRTNIGKGEF